MLQCLHRFILCQGQLLCQDQRTKNIFASLASATGIADAVLSKTLCDKPFFPHLAGFIANPVFSAGEIFEVFAWGLSET